MALALVTPFLMTLVLVTLFLMALVTPALMTLVAVALATLALVTFLVALAFVTLANLCS